MRADLNKQLCERERRGSKRKYREVRHSKKFTANPGEEGENLPSFESTMHRYGYETKDFNENLNPLYSQLRKAVGRPWSKFYSELCQNFDKRSVINQHILQHLYDRLEINVRIKDDELWVDSKYGTPCLLKDSWCEYYVDPRDGIIKVNKGRETYRQTQRRRAQEAAAKEAAVTHWLDSTHVLRKIKDVWFIFEMKPIPPATYEYSKPANVDVFKTGWRGTGKEKIWDQLDEGERKKFGIKRLIGNSCYDVFYGTSVNGAPEYGRRKTEYHASKRTASHNVLKKAKLV